MGEVHLASDFQLVAVWLDFSQEQGTQEGQLAGDTNGQFQTDCGEVG